MFSDSFDTLLFALLPQRTEICRGWFWAGDMERIAHGGNTEIVILWVVIYGLASTYFVLKIWTKNLNLRTLCPKKLNWKTKIKEILANF